MSRNKNKSALPNYRGSQWIPEGLPTEVVEWPIEKQQSSAKERNKKISFKESLDKAITESKWKWPKRTIYFLSDLHADSEAFIASLVASGGIRKSGSGILDFKLTKAGRKAIFIIGGDCLDKGPSSLQLLRCIRKLLKIGARVKLLAGNHDVRLLMGILAMSLERDLRTEHLFLRMGPKVVPLLKEIHAEFLQGKKALKGVPDKEECKRRLYPSEQWFEEFPKAVAWLMPDKGIEREMSRMRKKVDSFEGVCTKAGLSLRDVYAAAMKCRELFLKPKGEFYWFFRDMQLLYQKGSFLFIHAGLNDRITSVIAEENVGYLNRLFRKQIKHDLFEFYYGPLANTMRTKYREVDMPLTHHGVKRTYRQGICAIVHGHSNRIKGQQITLRYGMIHIECDITMDRSSRKKEGLNGFGVGVTIIRPEGQVIGISNDYPYAKVFEPKMYIQQRARKNNATE